MKLPTHEPIRVLLIEDEDYDIRRIQRTLRPVAERIQIVDTVSNGKAAVELLSQGGDYDVVIMDYQIAGGLKGEALVSKLREVDPTVQIIVITKMTTNVTDFDFANRLLEAGAMWYCTKYPYDIEEFIYQPTDFVLSIFNAYERRLLEKARRRADSRLQNTIQEILDRKQIVGVSRAMMELRQAIRRYAETDAVVLLRGESGTGKELIAANIHYLSRRKSEPFVPVNCGSLPEQLIESELFGYEKGSFTGATARKKGLFEVADKGSLFLDEITEIPLAAQSTLLRVIQEGEIDKIGRTGRYKVDVRIIAATNKDLERLVREGRFREDLYYRLNVLSITAPPLRERPEDIPVLVDYYLRRFSADMGRPVPQLEQAALQALTAHSWPGNVRELQNVLQRLLINGAPVITLRDVQAALGLHAALQQGEREARPWSWDRQNIMPLREMERQFRREYLRFVRSQTTSDALAARKLGLAPSNFHRLCKELGLK
ncbi:MAG: sigma-54-dependent Fis family transcriptional regulator [Calditrichaeota bacterium]|nr:sigma-54-dependent Fis family transcriptional regulator [Calditrichota bacterium]